MVFEVQATGVASFFFYDFREFDLSWDFKHKSPQPSTRFDRARIETKPSVPGAPPSYLMVWGA